MRKPILFLISAVAVSLPAVPSLYAQTSAVSDPKNKTVCKGRQRTGTRFAGRTCRTVREWDEIEEQNKRGAAELINRPQIEIRKGN